MTSRQYEALSRPFRDNPVLTKGVLTLNFLIPLVCYVMYPLLLVLQIMQGDAQWIRTLAATGIPFIAVSIFRKLYNRPRPYEVFGYRPLIPKDKQGQSFPSRHVFSAFIIAMCWLFYVPPAGIMLLVMAAMLGALRVIGGVHFVSDVVVGALVGIVSGVIGFILI